MNKTRLILCAAAAVATAMLTGCGGGGGSADPSTQATVEYVPAAASESITAFAQWMKQISAESTDGRDALDTSTFTPKAQEDTDPIASPV